MEIRYKKIRESNRNTTLLLIPIIAILAKLVQLFILPDKYFYDSTRMQAMMNNEAVMGWWSGYETTVEFFKKINIFNFTKIQQWSISLGIILTVLIMFIISQVKEMSMMECIYTLMAVGLLNIYVFNIAKEPIQMLYFFAIMIVILLPIKNTFIKIIACAAIYIWEANSFREYYIMMACMSVFLYFIFLWLRGIKGKIRKKYIIIAVILCFAAMFAFVYASQFFDREAFDDVMIVRDKYANEAATTAIKNLIQVNGNFGLFMFNYVICAIRMMFPIELIFKSPVYAPFFIYQIFILVYWIRSIINLKHLNNRVLLSLTCFTAYLFGSFVFEPDFGSWVRHEAAGFPIFYFMAYEDLGKNKKIFEDRIYEAKNV